MNKAVKEFADHYGLLDELIAQEIVPPLADGELTIARLAGRAGCGLKKAQNMLDKWVKDGRAEFVGPRRGDGGHVVKAWRLK